MHKLQTFPPMLVFLIALLNKSVQGQVAQWSNEENSTTEIYMLSFMNITTDNPEMNTLQQLVISAWDDSTIFYGRTAGLEVYIPGSVVPEEDDGNIGDYYMTREHLVAAADDRISNLGFLLVADKHVCLQLTKSVQASADAYTAMPLTHGSTEFYMLSYDTFPTGFSTYAITAIEEDTCIEVWYVDGEDTIYPLDIATIGPFRTFNGFSDTIDGTGIYVNSSKPISVFLGHMCAEIPVDVPYCDHIQTQVPPVEEWGTEFIIPGIRGRYPGAGYRYRVVAHQDNTQIRQNGELVATINRGKGFYEGTVDLAYANIIVKCSNPCLVAQYNTGYLSNYDPDIAYLKKTDPFLTLIPSITNYQKSLRFGTSNFIADGDVEIFENHLAIVVPTPHKGEVLLNLTYVNDYGILWDDLDDGYSVANLEIPHGLNNLGTESGIVDIMGFAYGHGLTHITGYGYPVGFKMNGKLLRSSPIQRETGVGNPEPPVIGTCNTPFNPARVKKTDTMQQFLVTFNLDPPLEGPCADQALKDMEAKLPSILNTTNWLICLNLLCVPAEQTWVYSINMLQPSEEDPLTSLTFQVTLWSHITEKMKNAIACRRHVAEYLSNFADYSERWLVPHDITADGFYESCPALDFKSPGSILTLDATCAKSV